ncbi:MAG: SDR family oxidoreductase [Alphaproteobacteria bacterium]|nr:SDR family oxidoreductase [Alphaproteobacteria bacterium]
MKTIIVTGGSGFIGSNLCKRLINDGNKVICVDNNYTGRMCNIEGLLSHPNFKFVLHDITEPLDITEKIDQIYNLACPASPPAYQGEHAIDTTKTCIIGAINILELARKNQATILQTSTSEVYGEPEVHPQREDYWGFVNPTGIRSCYDEGKRCAESLFFSYHRIYNMPVKVVRIFNTYGPNMRHDDGRVVSNFICQSLQNQDLTIYGDGKQTRSLCFVDDTVEALVRMMNSDKDFTGPVNIGNPEEHSISEIAEIITKKINNSSKVCYMERPADDPTRRQPDISLAKQKLNWQPLTSLDDGLSKTIAYYKIDLQRYK